MGTPQSPKNVGGVSANSVMIPILTILSVLHIIIIILSVSINTTSNTLTKIMRDSGEHINEATSLLAGSSLMSETSSNFILLPEAKNGAINIHPLIAYANELSVPRRGNQVLARFREYGEGESYGKRWGVGGADRGRARGTDGVAANGEERECRRGR